MKVSGLLLALLAAMALAACGGNGQPAATPEEPTPAHGASTAGKIALTCLREGDGTADIFIANPDGTGLTNLTNNPARDDAPAWSPDGSRIAFFSDRDGNQEIYVMNADGSGQINLTDNPADDTFPTWSPDGSRIAFASEQRDSNFEIYLMNADGSGQTNIAKDIDDDELRFVVWSPDGKRIAFVSERDGKEGLYESNREIWVANADGSGLTRLTNNSVEDSWPAWSPDGKRIAFLSLRDGNPEVYIMNDDGFGQTNLTNNPAEDGIIGAQLGGGSAWSPDGERIAFESNDWLYAMNADGSGLTRLTDGDIDGYAWSPDGKKIAFESLDGDIYVVNADGSGVTRLTDHPATDAFPAWSPDGKRIAFQRGFVWGEDLGVAYVMNADGTGQTRIGEGDCVFPLWSPAQE